MIVVDDFYFEQVLKKKLHLHSLVLDFSLTFQRPILLFSLIKILINNENRNYLE